jgi:hypothetical protein
MLEYLLHIDGMLDEAPLYDTLILTPTLTPNP